MLGFVIVVCLFLITILGRVGCGEIPPVRTKTSPRKLVSTKLFGSPANIPPGVMALDLGTEASQV